MKLIYKLRTLFLICFSLISLYSFGQKFTGLTATSSTGTASAAVDGNMGTRWESEHLDPQWIIVDLGEVKNIGIVKIYWEGANAKDYTLSFSTNGVDFTDELSYTNMAAGTRTDLIDNLNISCQYIKMYGTARNLTYGYSIWEFEVYPQITPELTSLAINPSSTSISLGETKEFAVSGLDQVGNPYTLTNSTSWSVDGSGASIDANGLFSTTQKGYYTITATNTGISQTANIEVLPSNSNLSIGATTTASSGNAAAAIDNNSGTRWESASSDPQWIEVDLGTAKHITDIYISWEAANSKDYIIETSLNNSDWSTLISQTNMDGGSRIDRIYDISADAQYVRLTGTARNLVYGHSIWEFRIFGVAPNSYRSKSSGNWEDISSWENSTDLTSWTDAVSVPGTNATSIEIMDSHLVTMTDNASVSSITLYSDAKLTLDAGKTLDVTTLTLKSDATGTATILDNGTLNVASVKVQQYFDAARNWYISSPLSAVNTPAGYTYYNYDETTNTWPSVAAGSAMEVGKGYIVQSTGAATIEFDGSSLNTGEITISNLSKTNAVAKSGFNLVGNPYPSYLSWTNATKTNLENTIWYRTKNTSGTYVFDTFNGVGTNNNLSGAVTDLIPPMQAFWVRASEDGGSLVFDNTMRSHNDVTSNKFRAPSALPSDQKVLRLKVTNGINSDEAIVLFNPNASNDIDAFDSQKMTNDDVTIPEIYTTIGSEKLVINGMNSINRNMEIPLGFTTGESNTFSIVATQFKDFETGTSIILKDNLLNQEQELSEGSTYDFCSDATTDANRFTLIFRVTGVTTSLNSLNNDKNVIVGRNKDNQITISILNEIVQPNTIEIYNLTGQKLYSLKSADHTISINKQLIVGVYFIKIQGNGKSTTKKIVVD